MGKEECISDKVNIMMCGRQTEGRDRVLDSEFTFSYLSQSAGYLKLQLDACHNSDLYEREI